MEPNEIYNEINELRVLIFMEIEPQSNKYNQVIFDREQYKEIGKHLGKFIENKDGLEMYNTTFSEEEYTLPDLIPVMEK